MMYSIDPTQSVWCVEQFHAGTRDNTKRNYHNYQKRFCKYVKQHNFNPFDFGNNIIPYGNLLPFIILFISTVVRKNRNSSSLGPIVSALKNFYAINGHRGECLFDKSPYFIEFKHYMHKIFKTPPTKRFPILLHQLKKYITFFTIN